MLRGDGLYLERPGQKTAAQTAAGLGKDIADNIPFVGGLLGGGRLPIASALPDMLKVGSAWVSLSANEGSGRKHRDTLGKELFKPVYYLALPVGGGQIKKAVEGLRAVLSGGMYTVGREGEDILRYPVFNESPAELAGNLAAASLFGPTSLPTAREWVESGFQDRTAAETATYQALQELGVGGRDAYRVVRTLQTTEKEGDQSAAQRKRALKEESALTNEQKLAAYYGMLASKEERALVDRLPLEGKQAGEVYRALSALHAVEDDKDIEEKKEEKILRLSHTGLTEEAKAERSIWTGWPERRSRRRPRRWRASAA